MPEVDLLHLPPTWTATSPKRGDLIRMNQDRLWTLLLILCHPTHSMNTPAAPNAGAGWVTNGLLTVSFLGYFSSEPTFMSGGSGCSSS